MDKLDLPAKQWLTNLLGMPFTMSKHAHSHQDDVYHTKTEHDGYYLKVSTTLTAERDNLLKLTARLHAPRVIDFCHTAERDYLLITELPGKNLVELLPQLSETAIVEIFAKAVRHLHATDITALFPGTAPGDVLIHGDMALPNIILSEEGVIGYIDFGQMTYGHPELDLVDAIWSLQRNIGPEYGELFLEKYGPITKTPKIEAALAFRYTPPEDSDS